MEPEFPEKQLTWPIKLKVLFANFKQRWDFAKTKPGTVKLMCARFVHEGFQKIALELLMQKVVEPAQEWAEAKLGCGSGSESDSSCASSASDSGSDATDDEAGEEPGSGCAGGPVSESTDRAPRAPPHGHESHAPHGEEDHVGHDGEHPRAPGHPHTPGHTFGQAPDEWHNRSGEILMQVVGDGEHGMAKDRAGSETREEMAAEKEGVKAMAKRRILLRLALSFVYAAWAIMTVRAPSPRGFQKGFQKGFLQEPAAAPLQL
jgi:hypothetical protein